MICFLTSSPCCGDKKLDTRNGFADELKHAVQEPCSCLFVCSDPDDYEFTDGFAKEIEECFYNSGFRFSDFNILDSRNEGSAYKFVQNSNLIVLAGGHVPTQNRFFNKIGLRNLLKNYKGVIVGISAGTMNSADIVYAQPELPGEAVSTDYKRFLKGLGLTKIMVLPHYQKIKNDKVDGFRVFEDITYPDSFGRKFYALVDGSYILIKNHVEEIRGEGYLIENGNINKISSLEEKLTLI